ncbi:MAG: D-alanine--D-alanine ligase [Acidobacteriia bacterium]|nr:D-alanine--D-alanine ligase [Terriglobia bacterium]
MQDSPKQFHYRGVAIVADLFDNKEDTPLHLRHDLEMTHEETREAVLTAVRELGLKAYLYETPRALATYAANHTNDVVLSLFGGKHSRNRLALIPAICEAFGLAYVGADAYSSIICQDKEVAKAIARDAGLDVASHRIIRHASDSGSMDLPMPYVVKPLWEGSSIGIGPDNLVRTSSQGKAVIQRVLDTFHQPVLVEAFIPGREVSWCFLNGGGTDLVRSFTEIVWNDEPMHFDDHLYDAEHKSDDEKRAFRNIMKELEGGDAEAMERMLKLIGGLNYGRIDGKLKEGKFTFIEITPDPWLDPSGVFSSRFGLPFQEVIARLLLSARKFPQDQ